MVGVQLHCFLNTDLDGRFTPGDKHSGMHCLRWRTLNAWMLWGSVKHLPTGNQTVIRWVSRTSFGQYTELPRLACSVVSLGLHVTSDVIQFRTFSADAERNGVHVT